MHIFYLQGVFFVNFIVNEEKGDMIMTMGHKIAELRLQKNISQKKLAELLNVSPGLVGMWETNKRLPSLDVFISIIDFFDISADVLLNDERKYPHIQDTSSVIEPKLKDLIYVFNKMDSDSRDILIGTAKTTLREQQLLEKSPSSSVTTAKAI